MDTTEPPSLYACEPTDVHHPVTIRFGIAAALILLFNHPDKNPFVMKKGVPF
jgi:hypothetical protein